MGNKERRRLHLRNILFLPGAAGAPEFWHGVGERLPSTWNKLYLEWPGLGDQPHDPDVGGFADLVAIAEGKINNQTVLVAQSMGGIVAIRLALKHPKLVTHLVLTATSGGIDTAILGATDWRENYLKSFPGSARWIIDSRPDHIDHLPAIEIPTLLLWGDSDPISPLSIGNRLKELLPNSRLVVIPGGTHSFAVDHAEEVSVLIQEHLKI